MDTGMQSRHTTTDNVGRESKTTGMQTEGDENMWIENNTHLYQGRPIEV